MVWFHGSEHKPPFAGSTFPVKVPLAVIVCVAALEKLGSRGFGRIFEKKGAFLLR